MENPTPLPPPPNPLTPHNSTNRLNQTTLNNSMENFQKFIFKLAETRPNNPLTSPTKTLLRSRLNRFVAEYKTPDHLPYSAMIQGALEELNEKRGSSEESISQYIEERYDNLPWAHSELLKHHLEKLCQLGEIIETSDKRYALPVNLSSSAQGKERPPRRRKWRKWRYDFERLRNQRLKKKLPKKRKQKLREEISEQTERLQACVDEKVYSEEAGPSEADTRAAQRHEQQETEERPKVHSLIVKLRPRPAKTEVAILASSNEVQRSQPKCQRLKVVFRQKPVEADVENSGQRSGDIKTVRDIRFRYQRRKGGRKNEQ